MIRAKRRVFDPRSGCWSLVDPHPCVEPHLPFAHDGAVLDADLVCACEFFDLQMIGATRMRPFVAQPSRQAVAVGIANLLNERGLHDLRPLNKKRAAQTRRKALPPGVLAARSVVLTRPRGATEMYRPFLWWR